MISGSGCFDTRCAEGVLAGPSSSSAKVIGEGIWPALALVAEKWLSLRDGLVESKSSTWTVEVRESLGDDGAECSLKSWRSLDSASTVASRRGSESDIGSFMGRSWGHLATAVFQGNKAQEKLARRKEEKAARQEAGHMRQEHGEG